MVVFPFIDVLGRVEGVIIGAVYLLHGVNKLLRLFGYKDCVFF